MEKPASRISTPSSTSFLAMASFSGTVMLQPGDCSPSRSVVSKIYTRSVTWALCACAVRFGKFIIFAVSIYQCYIEIGDGTLFPSGISHGCNGEKLLARGDQTASDAARGIAFHPAAGERTGRKTDRPFRQRSD